MGVTDEIKSRLNIVDVIGSTVQLKKAGRNYKGLCPFHSERTPSFVVYSDSQTWRCFGACNEGGDLFNFVMKREGWDFPEALRYLAQQAGVELEPMSAEQAGRNEARDRLSSLLNDAAHYFHQQFLNAKEAAPARSYIDGRGFTEQTIASFGIGYAPNSWDAGSRHLIALGYQMQELIDAGLVIVRDEGGTYDRFRDRVVIPIRDVRGGVVGFGARGLTAEATPKYLNSPQSELFDKSSLLFGLDLARNTIRDDETAVIVEGYMDTIQAHQAGFSNVVAQMGTALTEQQLKLLSRYATKLILALDPDAAGQMATDRGREVIERVSQEGFEQVKLAAKDSLDIAEREHKAKLVHEFDINGILQYKSGLGFDVRVILLPKGKDPDDLIRETPNEWARLVNEAIPVVEYVIQSTISGKNLNDQTVKTRILETLVPIINNIPKQVERTFYQQKLARYLKIEERILFPNQYAVASSSQEQSKKAFGKGRSPRQDLNVPDLTVTPTAYKEAFGLVSLIHNPRLIYQVNRVLAECMPPASEDGHVLSATLSTELTDSDFTHPEYRLIFNGWCMALNQHETDPLPFLIETLDPLIKSHLMSLLDQPLYALEKRVVPEGTKIMPDRVFEMALQALLDLRRVRLDDHIKELQYMLSDADQGNERSVVWDHGETIRQLIASRFRLDQARRHFGAPGSSGRVLFAKPKTAQ